MSIDKMAFCTEAFFIHFAVSDRQNATSYQLCYVHGQNSASDHHCSVRKSSFILAYKSSFILAYSGAACERSLVLHISIHCVNNCAKDVSLNKLHIQVLITTHPCHNIWLAANNRLVEPTVAKATRPFLHLGASGPTCGTPSP